MLKCKLERRNLSLHHSDSAGKIIIEAKIERDEFSVEANTIYKAGDKVCTSTFWNCKLISDRHGQSLTPRFALLLNEAQILHEPDWKLKVMVYLHMHWNKINSFCCSPYIALTEKRRLCFPSILWSVSSRDIILPFEQQKGNVASASKLRTV